MGAVQDELRGDGVVDPEALLELAWAHEVHLRIYERSTALDRLEELLESDRGLKAAPHGRDWELELIAERAVSAAADARLQEALELADEVLQRAPAACRIAIARATLARARAWAWEGTEDTRRQGDRLLADAAELFAQLGRPEWQGFAVFWRGYAVHFEVGHIRRAAELMEEALAILGPQSPRRGTVLCFYAETLIELGELDRAQAALSEAIDLAQVHDNGFQRSYVAWTQAHIESAKGDAYSVERLVREVERDAGDWFETHIGVAFLCDSALMLSTLGLDAQAQAYYDKALVRAADGDETVRQAHALMLARSGDPAEALDALQALTRGDWLDKRLSWRHSLLSAWATFRAGREGAGELAARALDQAIERGGIATALVHERELTLGLAPLAELAGSAPARALLLGEDRRFIVRLFGEPRVVAADGRVIELPSGMPGELVRMLALHHNGLPTEVVLEAFFPDARPDAARNRLRQVLARLRAGAGDELVIRSEERLCLAPAWVDAREFVTAADRVRAARGQGSVRQAYVALALWRGPLLPADPYAAWAEEPRAEAEYRHLALLDLVAADAIRRSSHQEALTALEAAMRADPDNRERMAAAAEQLRTLGRDSSADYLTPAQTRAGRTAPH